MLDNNNEQYNKSIIETFSPTKFELDNSVRFNLPKVKSTVTLKQIINKDALGNLYHQSTDRDYYFKVTDLKKNENQIRDDMSKVTAKKRINKLLERHIPIDQIDIIKYINKKSEISESFINKISQASNEKQKIYNKICQKTLKKHEDEIVQGELFKETLNKIKIKMKEESIKLMNHLDVVSLKEEVVFDDYKFHSNKRPMEVLIDRTNKYKQIWKRMHLDRFNSRTTYRRNK